VRRRQNKEKGGEAEEQRKWILHLRGREGGGGGGGGGRKIISQPKTD
jgi:hypothetical protein